jgi:hypothetical protein
MLKLIAGLGVIGVIVLGVAATAAADDDRRGEEHHRAPEPVTALALAGGVGTALFARWVVGRKSDRK